jgi:hypothetical protein
VNDSLLPLGILLLGVAGIAGFIALRPWPASPESTPISAGAYVVEILQGQPPAASVSKKESGKQASTIAEIENGLAALMLIGAGFAWILRPPLGAIDERAKDRIAEAEASATPAANPGPGDASSATSDAPVRLICVLDPQRSRVTVSDITDVPLQWGAGGCVNGKTQYGLAQDGWSRVLLPKDEDTISVTHYDPDTHTYTLERFLMGIADMNRARAEKQKIAFPPCGASEELARQLGTAQGAIRAMLPPEPNERMRYSCQPAR